MSRDRSMATAAYPLRCAKRQVRVEGSWSGGSYSSRIVGYHGIIAMSDGGEVPCCTSPHGHKKNSTLVACSTAKVAELNDAAGIPESAR